MTTEWRDGSTAPKDGTKFWGWLYDGGIHMMRWVSAEENAENDGGLPEEYISCFVKCADEADGDWDVKFWLPINAIKLPPGVVWVNGLNRWRDEAPVQHR